MEIRRTSSSVSLSGIENLEAVLSPCDAKINESAGAILRESGAALDRAKSLPSLRERGVALEMVGKKLETVEQSLERAALEVSQKQQALSRVKVSHNKSHQALEKDAVSVQEKLGKLQNRLERAQIQKPLTLFQKLISLFGIKPKTRESEVAELRSQLKNLQDTHSILDGRLKISAQEGLRIAKTEQDLQAYQSTHSALKMELTEKKSQHEAFVRELSQKKESIGSILSSYTDGIQRQYERSLDRPLVRLGGAQREKAIDMRARQCAFRMFYQENAIPTVIKERLSGATFEDSIQATLRDIKSATTLADGERQQMLSAMQELATFTGQINIRASDESITKGDMLAAIIDNVLDKVEALPIGGRLLLPGGYNTADDSKGHAVLYEVVRGAEGFSLNVYNTGQGGNWNTAVQEYKFPSRLEEGGNSPQSVAKNAQFWRGLLGFLASEGLEKKGFWDEEMVNINDYLRSQLGTPKQGDSIPGQTWGTCTHMCLRGWIHRQVSSEKYNAFHLEMRREAAARCKDLIAGLSHDDKRKLVGNGADAEELGQSVILALDRKVKAIETDSPLARATYYAGQIARSFFGF